MGSNLLLDALTMLWRALTTNSPLGWTVSIAIVAIGLLAIAGIIQVQLQTRSERRRLATAEVELEELGGISAPIADEDVIAKLEMLPHGATRTAIAALQSMRRFPNPNVSTAISVVSQSEVDKLARLRPIPNNLMMLGLLGTVLGLAAVIGTLGPQVSSALSATDPSRLAEAIGLTLSEMKTAFSCTIYGVLFSIIVAASLNAATRDQSRFLEEVETAIVHRFAPAILPKSNEYQLEELRKVLQYSQDFLISFRTSIRESAESFHTVLLAAGETTRISIEGLHDSTQTMSKLLSQISQGVTQASVALQEASNALGQESQVLAATSSKLPEHLARLEESLVKEKRAGELELRSGLAGVSSSVIATLEALQGTLTATLAEARQDASAHYQAAANLLREGTHTAKNLEGTLLQLSGALVSSDQTLAAEIRTIRQHQESLEGGVALLSSIESVLVTSRAREEALLAKILERLEGWNPRLEQGPHAPHGDSETISPLGSDQDRVHATQTPGQTPVPHGENDESRHL